MDGFVIIGILLNAAIIVGLWCIDVRPRKTYDWKADLERRQDSSSDSSSG